METIKCQSCGAVQDYIDDKNKCDYCGNTIELQQSKDFYKETLSGETGNLMAMADTAIDATNWDEALQFYNRVLEKDITNSDAWLGKGIAIVYTSKIGELKTTEAIAYWKNALKHATNKEAMSKRVAKEINTVVNSFYPNLENHFIQFKDLDNSYGELVNKFAILEKAQEYATQLDVDNIELYQTGYDLCKKVIQIPNSYALADEMGAWATGIAGALTQNKYQTQDASRQRNDAKKRQEEIKKAAVIVNLLEVKYLKNIRRLGGDSITTNLITKENEDEILKLYFAGDKSSEVKAIMMYHKITGFSLEQSKKDVVDLATKKGPIKLTEEKEDEIIKLYFENGEISKLNAWKKYQKLTGNNLEQSKKQVENILVKRGYNIEEINLVDKKNVKKNQIIFFGICIIIGLLIGAYLAIFK